MTALHITDIEAAINYWRERHPSPDGVLLQPEVRALAEVYALMIFWHETEVQVEGFPSHAMAAWLAWYDTTPDTPCIAICSTSQGDEMQGLWPQLRRSADVDRHGATTEARRMAQDHDRRRLLALYPLCRACGRARGHIAQTRLIAVYRTEPVRCCRRPNISPHAADRRFQPPPPPPLHAPHGK